MDMIGREKKAPEIGFTDKQLKSIAMKAVGEYLKKNSTGVTDIKECMDLELDAIKMAWKEKSHKRSAPLTKDEVEMLTTTYLGLEPELRKMTQDKALAYKRAVKTRAINSTTTKAIITGALESSGLRYQIIEQQYRLKVLIGLERKSVILLHIHYKDIVGKNIDGLIPALQAINDLVKKN